MNFSQCLYICRAFASLCYTTILIAFTVGCGPMTVPSTTKPVAHPLLDSTSWLQHQHTPRSRQPRRRTSIPTSLKPHLNRVVRNLDGLKPKQLREPKQSLELIRAAFSKTEYRKRLDSIRTMEALRDASQTIVGPFQSGDLVFFQDHTGVPPVGVLRRQRTDGTLEIIGISRGKIRTIKAHVHRRSRRRSKGRVLNTFLRPKRPGDAKRTPYLAGQLIISIRRLLVSNGGSQP